MATVVADAICWSEFGATAYVPPIEIEWTGSVTVDKLTPVEQTGGTHIVITDRGLSIEVLHTQRRGSPLPEESAGITPSGYIQVEWGGLFVGNMLPRAEVLSSTNAVTIDALLRLEWLQNSVAVLVNILKAIETTAKVQID